MSLSNVFNANLTDGVYKIFSVRYPDQDVDLIFPGGVNGTIAGFHTNNGSQRMEWKVTNKFVDPITPQVTFVNQEITTYAQVANSTANTQVTGGADEMIWSLAPTSSGDVYRILLFDVQLAWTLPDGDDQTPITIEPMADPPQDNQLWKFERAG